MDDLISRAVLLRMLDENGVVFRGEIEKIPAVDAIPISWIISWCFKRYMETKVEISVPDMIEAWWKEQEVTQ